MFKEAQAERGVCRYCTQDTCETGSNPEGRSQRGSRQVAVRMNIKARRRCRTSGGRSSRLEKLAKESNRPNRSLLWRVGLGPSDTP